MNMGTLMKRGRIQDCFIIGTRLWHVTIASDLLPWASVDRWEVERPLFCFNCVEHFATNILFRTLCTCAG